MALSNSKNQYNDESISSLKGADRVRLRPSVIFGSDGLEGCEHTVFEILSNSIDEAREVLFQGNVKLVIYTKGSEGAEAFTRNAKGSSPGKKVKAVDTTGAGDAFIGSFLYQLTRDGVGKEDLESLSKEKLEEYLDYSNEYCARSVVKQGAIASYPREF